VAGYGEKYILELDYSIRSLDFNTPSGV